MTLPLVSSNLPPGACDVIGGLGPDEGPGIGVVEIEVLLDGLLELAGRAMSTAADAGLGEGGKPAFDLVDPGGGGRGEVHVKSRTAGKPGADRCGLEGAVVVHHEMDVQVWRDVVLDGVQEAQELGCAVPGLRLAASSTLRTSSTPRRLLSCSTERMGCSTTRPTTADPDRMPREHCESLAAHLRRLSVHPGGFYKLERERTARFIPGCRQMGVD